MKKEDLEYLLETLKYGLNDCDDSNGNTETHFNSFANAINVVQDELKLLRIGVVRNSVRQELERRVDLILSEPDGIVRETMIKNIPLDL